MRSQQGSTQQTLQRVQVFLDGQKGRLDAVNASSARRNLDDIVAQITGHIAAQDGGARGGLGETASLAVLRQSLRFQLMAPIAVVAKQRLRDVPEFRALQLPRGNLGIVALMGAA